MGYSPFFLCSDRYDRYMAMIGQLGRAGRFEDIGEEGMPPGEGQDQVDVVIGYELVNRFHEVKQTDEVEIRLVVAEFCFQLGPFRLVFFCYLDIMFMIDIDDVQTGFEQIEHVLYGLYRDSIVNIFKISE